MRKALALVLVLAGCGGSKYFPPPVIPPHPSGDDWPDAGAAVLDDVATLAFRVAPGEGGAPARVFAVLDHRRRMKILSEAGVAAARVDLPIDGYSSVSEVRGRSVSRAGDVSELEPGGIATVPGAAPGLATVRFTIPGASVGGLVEYRYTRVYDDVAFVPVWLFGGPYPVVRSELSLVPDPDVKLDYRFGRGERVEELLPLRRDEGGRERMVFVLQDLPAYYSEPYMPHLGRIAPWLAVTTTQVRTAQGSQRLETWDDVGLRLRDYFAQAGGEAGTGAPQSRYRKIRDAIHALALPGVGLLAPKKQPGPGDLVSARDAAGRLLAALEGAGVDASPALVAAPRGPNAPGDLPSLATFITPVVALRATGPAVDRAACEKGGAEVEPACRVKVNDWIFLAPGCHSCRYGELPWTLAGGRAVVLTQGGGEWVDLPLDPPEQHRLSLEYKLTFDSQGKVTGTVQGSATGNAGGALRQALSDADGSRDKLLAQTIFGADAVPAFQGVELTNEVNADQPLGFTAKTSGQLDKLGYERFQVRPKNLVGPALVGDFRATRRYDAVLDAPRVIEHTVTLDLPVGYDAEIQPKVAITTELADFTATFTRKDRSLVYTQKLRVKTPLIHPDDWQAWKDFLDQVDQAETSGIKVWVPE